MLEVKENKIDFATIFENALKTNYHSTHCYSFYDDYDDNDYYNCFYGDECDWWEEYEKMKKKDKKKNKTTKNKTYFDDDGELIELKDNKNKKQLINYTDNTKLIKFYPDTTKQHAYHFFTSLYELDNFLTEDVEISELDANYMMRTESFCATIKTFKDGIKKLVVDENFQSLKLCYDNTYA